MRDSWRAGISETDKTELVTGGIYQFSCNPAFFEFNLLYIGILLEWKGTICKIHFEQLLII